MDRGGEIGFCLVGVHGDVADVFQIADGILHQMSLSRRRHVDLKWGVALWLLGDTEQGTTLVQLFSASMIQMPTLALAASPASHPVPE